MTVFKGVHIDSYQNSWNKFVEEDDLDASHSQCDGSVHLRHVKICISFSGIGVIHHVKGEHFLVCYRYSLSDEKQQC